MTLYEIVCARTGLQQLVAQSLPLPIAYAVLELTERCNLQLNFYGSERAKLGEKPDPDRLRELHDMTIPEFDRFERIRIIMTDDVKLSPASMKALEPFVEFVHAPQ